MPTIHIYIYTCVYLKSQHNWEMVRDGMTRRPPPPRLGSQDRRHDP